LNPAPEYACVMVDPPKRTLLRSKIVTLTIQPHKVVGFDGEGNEYDTGLRFNKIISVHETENIDSHP